MSVRRKKAQRLPPNDAELNCNFQILPELIGRGSYSTIWKAKSQQVGDEVPMVAKVSQKQDTRTKKNFYSELTVLQQVKHPNILKLYSFFETSKYYYLFLEHHPNPSVNITAYIGACGGVVELETVIPIFAQLTSAVAFMHSNSIAHRDIKSDNVLINPETGHITLIDFGFSVRTTKLCDNFLTSPLYAPPEVLSFIPYDPSKADCWSLGVLLFQMVYGKFPFPAKDLNTLIKIVNSDEIAFPVEVIVPKYPEIKMIISRLLEKDPAKRMTAAELSVVCQQLKVKASA